MAILFKDMTATGLHERLAPLGVSLRQARQLQAAVLRHDAFPERMEEYSKPLLARVGEATTLPRLELLDQRVSANDGFAKFLFQGDGPDPFEAVRIPLLHREDDRKYIVCVSSQVGCAIGCAFCATGKLGFRRQLATWEIVDQVIRVRELSDHPVRGVVFMGMGEPFLNYEAVIRAAQVMSEPCGLAIAGKAISISTSGVVPGIRRFTAEKHPYRLVVSLTSADPEQRRILIPAEASWPTAELLQALRERHAATGERVTLAWTMIRGVNTRPEDAARLAELLQGLPVILDLIAVNDATGQFLPPERAELDRFRDALTEKLGAPVAWRYSGGQDIDAACGMLAGGGAPP